MKPTKTPIDPGTIARVSGQQPERRNVVQRLLAAAIRYALPGEIAIESWNPPGQPLPPVAQEEEGRLLDFPVGVNTQTRPRSLEGVSFGQLRALADNYDLLRLVIERRKDQIEALKWKFVTKAEGDDDGKDPRVEALTDFFARPDRVHGWGAWVRMIVEEVLVTDALTIYPRKTNGGSLYALDVMDGTTIKPIIDNTGRVPMPPFPAYQQYVKGQPMADYTLEDILYMPRNPRAHKFYGYSPVEQVIMTVSIAIRRQLHQLNYFTEGNIPEALIPVPETWTPKNISQFQKLWDSMNSQLEDKRKAKFIPNVKNVIFTREQTLKDAMDEWLARVICFAFSYPPSALTQQVNRATAETAKETGEDEGLTPLMQSVKSIIDEVVKTQFGFNDITFEWDVERSLDPAVEATIRKTDIEAGVITLDDARIATGRKPYGIKGQTDVPVFLREPTPAQQAAAAAAQQALAGNPEPNAGSEGDGGKNPPPPGKTKAKGSDGVPGDKGEPSGGGPVKKAASLLMVSDEGYAMQERDAVKKAEEELTDALTKAFESAANEVADAYAAKYGEAKKSAADELLVMEFIDGLSIGLGDASGVLAKSLKDIAVEGSNIALARIDIATQPVTNLANKQAAAYAKQRAGDLIAKSAKGGKLAEATRNMIRATIAEAVEEGATNEAVAKALRDSYAFSPKRAAAIAKTELRAADVQGNLAGYKASGVVTGKQWLLSNEPNVCPVCTANAEKGTIGLDEDFPSGDQGPPAHPVCRCDVAPVVE